MSEEGTEKSRNETEGSEGRQGEEKRKKEGRRGDGMRGEKTWNIKLLSDESALRI